MSGSSCSGSCKGRTGHRKEFEQPSANPLRAFLVLRIGEVPCEEAPDLASAHRRPCACGVVRRARLGGAVPGPVRQPRRLREPCAEDARHPRVPRLAGSLRGAEDAPADDARRDVPRLWEHIELVGVPPPRRGAEPQRRRRRDGLQRDGVDGTGCRSSRLVRARRR